VKLMNLQNMYGTICESRLVYRAEVWGLEEGWEEINRVQGSSCRNVSGIPRCAANGVAELKLGRESTRRNILSFVAKY
jgi:hypothetical protein